MASERPNILIFMNDQEQAQVTLPGHPCRTPNADRLAAEGVQFTRCYTTTAHCCPSRATFQTGLYPSGHGVYNNILNHAAIHTDLYAGVPTFGELLRHENYQMKWSGKWHVTKHRDPQDCGWDEILATAVGSDHHGRSWNDWHQRSEAGEDRVTERGNGELLRPGWGPYKLYGSRNTSARHDFNAGDYNVVTSGLVALDQVLEHNDPWCVFIGPHGPHDPYIITERYATMYDPADVEMPPNWKDDLSDRPVVYQRQHQFWSQLSEDEQREAVAHYWGYCTMQDDLLGMVLEKLDSSGQADNTLVLFMSDHGDYACAHGLWLKGIPAFDEGYHIPCIARWPEGIEQPGRTVDEFVTLADFFPTFLDLAQLPPRTKCHGRSLVPFLKNDSPADWPDHFASQMNGVELYYSQRIIQTKEWKYVFNGFDWDELYNLKDDPHETKNLAPTPDRPNPDAAEVIRELCAKLWQHSEATNDINNNPYPTTSLVPYGPMVGLG